MIGLDTIAIIDIFKGNESIKKLLINTKEPLASTQMCYLELIFGINPQNPKHKVEENYYNEFFNSLLNLSLTKESCKKSSEIFWRLKKQGKMIEQFDCVIAGILISNGINKIITPNTKHFENISELRVLDY